MNKVCYEIKDLAFPIILSQQGYDRFTVQYGDSILAHAYGLDSVSNLSYSEACSKLGQSIMHALACDSKLDNSVR